MSKTEQTTTTKQRTSCVAQKNKNRGSRPRADLRTIKFLLSMRGHTQSVNTFHCVFFARSLRRSATRCLGGFESLEEMGEFNISIEFTSPQRCLLACSWRWGDAALGTKTILRTCEVLCVFFMNQNIIWRPEQQKHTNCAIALKRANLND